MADRRTNMAVPIAIKWDEKEGNWLAQAPSLGLRLRANSQEEALGEIEDEIRDAVEEGLGIRDATISTSVDSLKATSTVGVIRRIDRSIFEFAAHEAEKEMQRQGYDCSIEVEPHGEEVCDE